MGKDREVLKTIRRRKLIDRTRDERRVIVKNSCRVESEGRWRRRYKMVDDIRTGKNYKITKWFA